MALFSRLCPFNRHWVNACGEPALSQVQFSRIQCWIKFSAGFWSSHSRWLWKCVNSRDNFKEEHERKDAPCTDDVTLVQQCWEALGEEGLQRCSVARDQEILFSVEDVQLSNERALGEIIAGEAKCKGPEWAWWVWREGLLGRQLSEAGTAGGRAGE